MGTGTAHISSPYSPLGKTSLLVSDETTLKINPIGISQLQIEMFGKSNFHLNTCFPD